MAYKIAHLFSPADLEKIRNAVSTAERHTAGEIVPYFVEASDDYEVAEWRCGASFALLVVAVTVAIHWYSDFWFSIDVALLLLSMGAAFFVGLIAARYIPPLKRFFSGRTLLDRRVGSRAVEAFLAEEVFRTRNRTGILLFISALEHKVIVLGDAGINAVVKMEQWKGIVDTVTRGIKSGKPVDGIIAAIGMAGTLLSASGVIRPPDDTDELSDELRVRER